MLTINSYRNVWGVVVLVCGVERLSWLSEVHAQHCEI